jgi:hypothetical protein
VKPRVEGKKSRMFGNRGALKYPYLLSLNTKPSTNLYEKYLGLEKSMGKLTTVLFLACFLSLRLLGQAPTLQIDVVTQNDKKSLIIEWLNNPDAKYEVYGASSISDANWEKLAELPQTDGVRGSYELPTQNGIFSQFFYISEVSVAPTPTEEPITIPGLKLGYDAHPCRDLCDGKSE